MKLTQELLTLKEASGVEWIVHKKSRSGGGISGPTGKTFGPITIKPTYTDKAEAEEHAKIASEYNPVGYMVSPSTRSSVKEGAFKELMMDAIERAINKIDIKGLPYDKAVDAIVKQLVDRNERGMFATDESTTREMVKSMFTPDDIQEGVNDGNWPKIIAHADEFRVEMDEDEQVHLFDGEQKIRVSMPYVVWKQLMRQ